MTTQSTIATAQHAIIDGLVDCEMLIAELYHAYGVLFPEVGSFWIAIGHEEETHARLLLELHTYLDHGHVFFNIGKFNQESLQPVRARIEGCVRAARSGKIALRDALFAACSIENSVMDARFYDTVTSNSPDFQRVAEALSKSTEGHVSAIQNMLTAVINEGGRKEA